MPFTSKKQARWAFATGQPWAEEWASHTNFSTLPTSANDRYEKGSLVKKAIFDEGGHVHPHIEKPQNTYARQDNTRLIGFGDDYSGEYQDPGKSSTIHDALNQAAFLPVVGEYADATNAALHLKKGNYEDAAWSAGAVLLPFVGGKALKEGYKGAKKAASKYFGKADDAGKSNLKGKGSSEIDWAKWNPKTPTINEGKLLKEYNYIEYITKKRGTWMKNADGSKFKGTPEQFVQQKSKNFNLAFPKVLKEDGKVIPIIHQSKKKFDFFDESKNLSNTGGANYGKGVYAIPEPFFDKRVAHSFDDMMDETTSRDIFTMWGNNKYRLYANEVPGMNKVTYKDRVPVTKDTKYEDIYAVVSPYDNKLKSTIGNRGTFDMSDPNIYHANGGNVEDPKDIQKRMLGETGHINSYRFNPERSWSYDEKGEKVPAIYHAPKQKPFVVTAEGTDAWRDKKQFEKDNPYPVDEAFYKMGARDQYNILEDWENARDDYVLDRIIGRNPREYHVARHGTGDGWVESFSPGERRYFKKRNMASNYGANKWNTGWSASDQPWYKQTAAGALNLLTTPVGVVTGAIDPNISMYEGLTGTEGIMSRDKDTDLAMRMGLDPLMYVGLGAYSSAGKGIVNLASKAGRLAVKGAEKGRKLLPKVKRGYIEGFTDDAGVYHSGKFDIGLKGKSFIDGTGKPIPALVDGKPITNWQWYVNRTADQVQKLNKVRKELNLTREGIDNRVFQAGDILFPIKSGMSQTGYAIRNYIDDLPYLPSKVKEASKTVVGYGEDSIKAITTSLGRLNPKQIAKAKKALEEGNSFIKEWVKTPEFQSRFRDYVARTKSGETLTPEAYAFMREQGKRAGEATQFSGLDRQMFPGILQTVLKGEAGSMKQVDDFLLREFINLEMNKLNEMGRKIIKGKNLEATFVSKKDKLYDLLTGEQTGILEGVITPSGIERGLVTRQNEKVAKWLGLLSNEERTLVRKYLELDNITSTALHEVTHKMTKGDELLTAPMLNDLVKGFSESTSFITDLGKTVENTKEWVKAIKDLKGKYIDTHLYSEEKAGKLIKELDPILESVWENVKRFVKENPTKNTAEGTSHYIQGEEYLKKVAKELFKLRPQSEAKRFHNVIKGNSAEAKKLRKEQLEGIEKFLEKIIGGKEGGKPGLQNMFNNPHGLRYLNDPTELMARLNEVRKGLEKEGLWSKNMKNIDPDDLHMMFWKYAQIAQTKKQPVNPNFLNMIAKQFETAEGTKNFADMFNKMLGGAGVTGLYQTLQGQEVEEQEYEDGGEVKEEPKEEVVEEVEEKVFNIEDREFDPRKFRAGIVAPEAGDSGFDYSLRPTGAGNPLGVLTGMYGSTAVGPYQFIYGQNKTKGVNQTLKEMGFKGSFSDFVGNKEWQEKLMDYKLERGKNKRYPFMAESIIKQYGPGGTNLTSGVEEGKDWSKTGVIPENWTFADIMALQHFAGHGNLRNYFKQVRTGELSKKQLLKQVPGGKNMTLGTYLEKFREGYKASPRALTEEEKKEIMDKFVSDASYLKVPYSTEEPSSTRVEKPITPTTYADGGEAIIEETKMVETPNMMEEQTVKEEIPLKKEKSPITVLNKEQEKSFALWRKGWGMDKAEFSREIQNYDIPGYFISKEWKNPGTSYRDTAWVR